MFSRRRAHHHEEDFWPAFVDALGTLLLVVVFILTFFVVSQYYMGAELLGKSKDYDSLHLETKELMERVKALNQELDGQKFLVAGATQEREKFESEKEENTLKVSSLEKDLANLQSLVENLKDARLISEQELQAKQARIDALDLELAEKLKNEVNQLKNYQSEFLQKLRDLMASRNDVRIEGDRFVFQSEVLFPLGSSVLDEEGKKNLSGVAKAILELSPQMPQSLNWVIQVDGHTDRLQMHDKTKTNWELSSARALSVVKFLIDQGVPPSRLAATGFGENHPIEESMTPEAHKKNRRIELKLTTR